MLKAHYHQLYGAFVYYASLGSGDPYHMPLNAFTTFLEEAGVPDNDSPNVKRSDCDTIFIMCNFQPDKKSPDVAVNNENAMMRFEFLEALVRIGGWHTGGAGQQAQQGQQAQLGQLMAGGVSAKHTAALLTGDTAMRKLMSESLLYVTPVIITPGIE